MLVPWRVITFTYIGILLHGLKAPSYAPSCEGGERGR